MSGSDLPPSAIGARRSALAWRIAPATLEFLLDIREISRSDRDLIDSLLFAAIMSANMAPVSRDPDLQLAYATLGDETPDAVRRPVSINAVAHSMRIPFETARRRVLAMARIGAIEITPRGVFIPNAAIASPAFTAALIRRHDRLGQFHAALEAAGALPSRAAAPLRPPSDPPVRITNRAIWEYVLRVTDGLTGVVGDHLTGLVLLGLLRQNIAGRPAEGLADWSRDPLAFARPARTAALARRLGLSAESCRRYILALEAAGFCRRSQRGVVAVLPLEQAPRLERLVLDNLANVQRMFSRLDQLGALDGWQAATQRRLGGSDAA